MIESGEVRAYADQEKLSIEEAARTMRYRFLMAQARRFNAQAVAVGHTADDQVETVLMHFIRGAGLAGSERHELPDNHPYVRPADPDRPSAAGYVARGNGCVLRGERVSAAA